MLLVSVGVVVVSVGVVVVSVGVVVVSVGVVVVSVGVVVVSAGMLVVCALAVSLEDVLVDTLCDEALPQPASAIAERNTATLYFIDPPSTPSTACIGARRRQPSHLTPLDASAIVLIPDAENYAIAEATLAARAAIETVAAANAVIRVPIALCPLCGILRGVNGSGKYLTLLGYRPPAARRTRHSHALPAGGSAQQAPATYTAPGAEERSDDTAPQRLRVSVDEGSTVGFTPSSTAEWKERLIEELLATPTGRFERLAREAPARSGLLQPPV